MRTVTAPDLDALEALVHARRTSLVMDTARPVPGDLIERLCRLAMWAPNHKRTWPWRFAIFTGDGRRRLGEEFAAALLANGTLHDAKLDDAKLDKTRTKYLRAPAVLLVGAAPDADTRRAIENGDAVAAGVQNILLGATAAGLASFWSSPPATSPELLALAGFEAGTRLVAAIYLGWPAGSAPVPERPPTAVTTVAR
jgi:nitroreductase